ncbi:uncharacterized protein KGF55_002354 [Candida pseudojiufengensis]|uniref:uncharacterized protein n=1 Tax=Candida pseudojiufengensis TaxID=497109 RepID=UPI002224210F|nr:uncharacterized protein KGF55_002354 [Candida pseudojiufengensis]KAI5963474.1 hypothetical protein KGF55_002354 [Candida pseudojiufengensis]
MSDVEEELIHRHSYETSNEINETNEQNSLSKTYPKKVEFEGENLTIDSNNWRDSKLLKLQIIASFLVFILFGLGEQTVGTIIPELQSDYKINDLKVSLIFFTSVMGYLIMAILNNISHDYLGIRGVSVMGATLMTLAYIIGSMKPPYFIFLLGYLSHGLGLGALDASLNAWMGNLIDSNQLLGILHGCYGIGSLITPSLITFLLEKKFNPWKWNQYYIFLAICGSSILIFVAYTFRFETPKKYKYLAQSRHEISKNQNQNQNEFELNDLNKDDFEINEDSDENNDNNEHSATFSQAIKSPLIWAFASILFIYVGGEASFGAWLVTYLLRVKKLSYKVSSYMATTFWLGLTIGRIILGFVTANFFKTELTANLIYILISLIGYILFWFFSFTQLTLILFIIVFITGIVVGPIFPTTVVSSVNILPAKYQTVGIGFICAFGGAGAAGIPFLIGLLAESSDIGLKAYPIIIIIMFATLLLFWTLIIIKFAKVYRRNMI